MKYLKEKNTFLFVVGLLILAIVTHFVWFDFSSILSFSDWQYWPKEATQNLWKNWGAWLSFSGFGNPNIQLSFLFFKSIWSGMVNFGFSFDTAVKLTFLLPIAFLGFLSPFVLSRKISKSNLIAFVVAVFYASTTYFLIRQTSHLPIAFVYALAPLIFFFFMKALESNKLNNWFVFTLVYWVGILYEIRIIYILTLVLISYFLVFYLKEIKEYWKNILVVGLSLIALNAFWILSISMGGGSEGISVSSRKLFGANLPDVSKGFTVSDWSWTGGYPSIIFESQATEWQLVLIPIIAFLGLFFWEKFSSKKRKEIIFFATLTLIGIFLTKQTREPWGDVYKWLYENFPGFSFFREASKFHLISALGYVGLLSLSFSLFKDGMISTKKKKIFYALSCVVLIVSAWNFKPIMTGEIRTLFVSRNIPEDYTKLNKFISEQPDFFRTMWVPWASRWGVFSTKHPKISLTEIQRNQWNKMVNFNSDEYNWALLEEKEITQVFREPYADNLFDNSSIKYVILPIRDTQNDDDFFRHYEGGRKAYAKELEKVNFLKKIDIGTKELVIYENENFKPHVYLTKRKENISQDVSFQRVNFEQINSSKYKIELNDFSGNEYLNFSEKFNSNWKLGVGDLNWTDVLLEKTSFVSAQNHFRNSAEFNSFFLSDNFIKKNSKNGNIVFTLYYKPQSYYYLGLIISVSVLGIILIYFCIKNILRKN